jgi:hypothetical protein
MRADRGEPKVVIAIAATRDYRDYEEYRDDCIRRRR